MMDREVLRIITARGAGDATLKKAAQAAFFAVRAADLLTGGAGHGIILIQ